MSKGGNVVVVVVVVLTSGGTVSGAAVVVVVVVCSWGSFSELTSGTSAVVVVVVVASVVVVAVVDVTGGGGAEVDVSKLKMCFDKYYCFVKNNIWVTNLRFYVCSRLNTTDLAFCLPPMTRLWRASLPRYIRPERR